MKPVQSLRATVLAAFTLLAGAAQAQGFDARWGLRWGQSPEEVRTQVTGWSELPPKGDMALFIVASSHFRHPAFPMQVVPASGNAWYFNTGVGVQGRAGKDNNRFYALAVRPGDVTSAVPEPQTLALTLIALTGALLARRRVL